MAHKLLLADDSVTIQKIVELMLAEEGFEIKTANNGEDALAAIPSFKPDIIIADVEMPKMNGYQLCDKIKKDPSTKNIPVILLAGAFEPIDESRVKQVMADDFIIKPFEAMEFTSKINAVLAAQEIGEEVAVAEVAAAEEDLWATEEILEAVEAQALPEVAAEAVILEEVIKPVEEPEFVPPPITEKVAPIEAKAVIPEIELPSKEEVRAMIDKTINERISSLVSTIDIREAILSSIMPSVKDFIDKTLPVLTEEILRESLEDTLKSVTKNVEQAMLLSISGFAERMLKEMLEGSLKSLSGEIERVIWETVPDLAETLISKEIERIKSEF